jgi:glycosyltransferase involved in cell wall biosynthesis
MSARPFVSIVVPAYNAGRTIDACLASLLAQEYPRDRYEVLVVDNRSTDDTAARIKHFPVRVIEERSRQCSYAARNRGLEAAGGELVAFTDADCAARPDWLSRLVAGFVDEHVGGVAGRVVPAPGRTLLEQFARRRGQVSQDVSMANRYLPFAITANAAYRREVLTRLRGLDETMISSGDANLAWRMQLVLGRQLRFAKDALVSHRHRATLRAFWRQHRVYGYGTAMLYDQFPACAKTLGQETRYWMVRVAYFSGRGLARLLQAPLAFRAGRLYFAEHFLEVLGTTSRFLGVLAYHWAHRPGGRPRPRALVPARRPFVLGPAAADGPRVSVVIPAYNRAELVADAIESALAQTAPDLEVIVVDDGSTDATRDVVRAYVARAPGRVRYLWQPNQGVAAARNAGAAAARGRHVAFLDSDDLWNPEKLARQLPVLEADPALGWVSAYADVVDAGGRRLLGRKPAQPPGSTLEELVVRGTAPPSTFLVRREALAQVGGFDPRAAGMDELDLCLRMAQRGWRTVCLEEPLIRYRRHGGGLSANPMTIHRAYVQIYERLLRAPRNGVPRAAARRRLARSHYLLGLAHLRRREPIAALRHLGRALGRAPLVGGQFVAAGDRWWRRGWLALKPYAALGGVGVVALWPRRGSRGGGG